MTHKINLKTSSEPEAAAANFAALADQLIQDSWHLPPEGDQSWREQDARRIFNRHGKDQIHDAENVPAMTEEAPGAAEEEWPQEPARKASRVVGVLLPVSLAASVMVFAVIFSMPQILTHLGAPRTAQERQLTQVSMIEPAQAITAAHQNQPGKLRPSLADGAGVPAARLVRATEPRQLRHVTTASRTQSGTSSPIHLAASGSSKPQSRTKRVATRLPPIGEAYFAGHTPAVAARKTAAADWKAETAKWDEMAARIQARREGYQTNENGAGTDSGASREFP